MSRPTLAQLAAWRRHPQVDAFLRVIREGETSQDEDAYRTIVGGGRFESFTDHPQQMVRIERLGVTSSAAGAYQFLARTWDALVEQFGFTDFRPSAQDLGAVALLAERGAIEPLLAGDLESAIRKAAPVWASLPGDVHGQGGITMERARRVFALYGGQEGPQSADQPAPITESQPEPPAPPAPSREVTAMPAPIFAALLPSLISAVPELAKLFGSGSAVATRNARAVEILAEVAKTSTAAVNEQQAVERIQADPQAREAFSTAVKERYWELSEAGSGGIGGARKADAERMASGKPAWASATFLMGALMLPLVYMIAASVTFNLGGAQWDPSVRASLATGIVSLVLGGLAGYYFGASRNAGVGTPVR